LARVQFLEAHAYIRKDKPSAAVSFRDRSEKAPRRLEKYPQSGQVIPEFPELSHREVIVRPYRFLYRVEKKTIWVVAVWHGAQEAD
jgi:plasmid stabilization system protein ParE